VHPFFAFLEEIIRTILKDFLTWSAEFERKRKNLSFKTTHFEAYAGRSYFC